MGHFRVNQLYGAFSDDVRGVIKFSDSLSLSLPLAAIPFSVLATWPDRPTASAVILPSSGTCRKFKSARVADDRGLHGPGPGLVAQMMFGFGLGSNYSNQTFWNISGFLCPFCFSNKKVIRSCVHLILVTQSGSGNKSRRLDFPGVFVAAPSQK
jgi:hypothetical protein